jgi:hypothetical protein
MEILMRRLDRVEQGNQRLKRAGLVVLVGLAAVVLVGQATPSEVAKVVEAEESVVRDSTGNVRTALIPSSLMLWDATGRIRTTLEVDSQNKVTLSLFGGKMLEGGATLSVDEDGALSLFLSEKGAGKVRITGTGVVLVDKNGQIRAELTLGPDGQPASWFRDKDGKTRAYLGLLPDGSGALTLLDDHGKFRATLDLLGLVLYDQSNKQRAVLAVTKDGPGLNLLDGSRIVRATLGSTSLEKERTGVVETRPPSSLVLFDKDGKVVWKAP